MRFFFVGYIMTSRHFEGGKDHQTNLLTWNVFLEGVLGHNLCLSLVIDVFCEPLKFEHMSHITRKCVFGDFQPGKIQTSLLSYKN